MKLTSKECNQFYIMWFFPELHLPCLLFLPSPLQLKEENGAFNELKSNSATLWTTDQTTPGLVKGACKEKKKTENLHRHTPGLVLKKDCPVMHHFSQFVGS